VLHCTPLLGLFNLPKPVYLVPTHTINASIRIRIRDRQILKSHLTNANFDQLRHITNKYEQPDNIVLLLFTTILLSLAEMYRCYCGDATSRHYKLTASYRPFSVQLCWPDHTL